MKSKYLLPSAYCALGILFGLFITTVVVAGECALSCTTVRVLAPALTFLVITALSVCALAFAMLSLRRKYVWLAVSASWLSGAGAYLVAFTAHALA